MDGIHVKYLNMCVLFAEVLVWQHSDVFIVWVFFTLIVRAAAEGISLISCSWFVF